MLGGIAGGVIDSAYEAKTVKTTHCQLFLAEARLTDNTVLTVATAEALLGSGDYIRAYRWCGRSFPHAGRGGGSYP